MRFTLVLVLAAVSAVFGAPRWHQLDGYTFEAYARDFGKVYKTGAERALRETIFNTRLAEIRAHNSNEQFTWKQGVNQFSDLSQAEFESYNGYSMGQHFRIAENLKHVRGEASEELLKTDVSALPTSVDWRTKGIITAVKDQGGCGSCWTFGTTETIESFYALKYGPAKLPVLSEQQIVDCVANPDDCGGTGGCGGGTPELAMAALMKTGQTSEKAYPYTGQDGTCMFNSSTPVVARLTNFTVLPSNQYAPVMAAVANLGPMIINVDASAWSAYESGIFNGCDQSDPDIDHVVQLVGYGTEGNQDYWLIRNSWADSWGEKGYMRLKRVSTEECGEDTNPSDGTGCKNGPPEVKVCGACGILYDVSYPVIA